MAENHSDLYKLKGQDAQERRRQDLLHNQERKRNELLDRHRQLVDNLIVPRQRKKQKDPIIELLMLSEWMRRPPEDLITHWMFICCPVGRRCIVYAQNGKTRAVGKRGKQFLQWETSLPGGSAKGKGSNSTTIIDCVYSDATRSFYVLDVLHWGELPLIGTEMSFRQFWIKSRLKDELPELSRKSTFNQHPIIYLDALACTKEHLEETLNRHPYFPDDCPKLDGILFYHREAHYTQGESPLVLWLKPFMMPEVIGVSISEEYMAERPENYENYVTYMTEFDDNYRLRKCRRKRIKDVEMDDESLSTTGETVDAEDENDEQLTIQKLVGVEILG